MTRMAIRNTLLAASILTVMSPLTAFEANAGVNTKKFHFVQGKFDKPPTMTMKYQNGKWNWIDSGPSFRGKAKIKLTSSVNRITNASLAVAPIGTKNWNILWTLPSGYKTYKFEELVPVNITKGMLSSNRGSAANLCGLFGGNKKVVRDMEVPARLHAATKKSGRKYTNGKLTVKVVCSPRVKVAPYKIAKVRMFTIPAKPVCNQPVRIAAEFISNKPGKVDFTLVRNDGAKQKQSMNTKYAKPISKGIWSKSYTLKKTTHRRYKVVLAKQAMASNWIDLKVTCSSGKKLGKVGKGSKLKG